MARKGLILILSAMFLWPFCGLSNSKITEQKEAFLNEAEQSMSKIKTLHAEFIQIRKIKLLKHEVKFKGLFFLQAPDKIAWQVYNPIRYSCVIDNKSISQWDADSKHKTVISVEKNNALRLLFKQLNYWFAGKFSNLRKEFICSIDRDKKILLFKPKKGLPQERFIKSISISLAKDLSCIKRIEIIEGNDDTQTITFYKTVINKKLPASVWQVVPK